ncbi:spore gernimation protein [Cohnella pontilimi]|uniref:Spore gernimation protein n=1 Tax=Cohnella pontilimi TaxID=2564100 RepID=A0A4U0FAJ1_9BACL|nr:endospore germination permease [Cohnella pontilimi]TJY41813.1 spore gernimation protein [Cohnella pontilimi]
MGRITQLQVYMLFSQFLYSTAIGFFVSHLVRQARFMVWVSVLLGAAIGLLITYFAYRLSIRRPDQTLGQYGSQIVGRWVHYPLMAAVIAVNLYAAAFITRQVIDFIVINFLPDTPHWAVALLFGFCVARGVRSGPVTVFRSAQGLFLLSVAATLTFPLFISNQIDTDMAIAFITWFEPAGIWNGTVIVAAIFSEMAFIIYFFPYITKRKSMMKSLSWATVTAALVVLMNAIPTIMLFGPELTANLTYPTLEVIRFIRAGTFLENLDPLLIIFWLFTTFLKIAIFTLTASIALTHTMKMDNSKSFSSMLTAAVFVFSIYLFPTAAHVERIAVESEATFLLLPNIVPVMYLTVDWLRSLAKPSAHKAQ